MERDADGFVKQPRSWKPWIVALVVVAGVGVAARAVMLSIAREDTAQARVDYIRKESTHQLSVQIARELVIRRVRKGDAKPTDKEYEAYKDAADAEHAFMDACRRCASASECERDRLVIVSGRASGTYNPCD